MRGPIVHYTPTDFPQGIIPNGAIAFIDRDGVLNIGKSTYINNSKGLEILDGAPLAIGRLRRAGYMTCIVTNQSPIMRGLWGEDELFEIHQSLREQFLQEDSDAHFDAISTCPHRHRDRCDCRKPNPGMLTLANSIMRSKEVIIEQGNQLTIEINSNFSPSDWWKDKIEPNHNLDAMIGDRNSDMGAGWAIGARLFRVPNEIGIRNVIDRILGDDDGDDFNPIR